MTKSERDAQRNESISELRAMLPAGSTVYTILRDVSRSGMSRVISCHILSPVERNGETKVEPWDVTYHVGRVLGYRRHAKKDGLVVGGCGMDMGFHVVSSLSRALYPDQVRADYVISQRWL